MPGESLLKTLKGHIRHKQNNESDNTTFDELCKNKSICRGEFDKMLDSAVFKKTFKELWSEISRQLQTDNVGYQKTGRYRQKCEAYLVDRLDPLSETIQNARRTVIDFLSDSENHGNTLSETIVKASRTLSTECAKIKEIKDANYFEAMILVEIYNDEKR